MPDTLTAADRAAIAAYAGPVNRIPRGTYTEPVCNAWGKATHLRIVQPGQAEPDAQVVEVVSKPKPKPKCNGRRPRVSTAELAEMAATMTAPEIAAAVSMDVSGLRKRLKQAGIIARPARG